MIVADTNILAYLLIEGDQTEVARRVWGKDPEWYMPTFRNVLANDMRHGSMTVEAAQNRFRVAASMVDGQTLEVAAAPISECVARHAISAYDAEFVCLAVELSVPLVTTDRKLIRQVPGIAISPETFAP